MKRTILAVAAGMILGSQPVLAEDDHFKGYYPHAAATYEVTVTNITRGQSFTPVLAATHRNSFRLFQLGQPVSDELSQLAEGGDINPLKTTLDASYRSVSNTASTAGLLNPGQSTTFEIQAGHGVKRLSLAAMLIPTNDTFVSLSAVKLPKYGSKTYRASAYDAGSEPNDELCANIPGPVCGGSGVSAGESGEGFVHISAGIHGEADLARSAYDWRESVATVTVRRVYK
ncbi:MAG: spondin domain-containing protein [Endozoicomonas sp.]|uniref:spondin domain-containing protein n=1 Tax=Endozoicomonas sp. TaxID=1892382 RepID=UPI003D9B3CE4